MTLKKRKIIGEQLKRTRGELRSEIEGIVGKEELDEFKKFAFKGNMMQMAIAFMLGASFKKVIGGLSEFIIMPMVNYAIGQTGTEWRETTYSPVESVVFEIGRFGAVFVDFILMSIILYVMWKKMIQPIFKDEKKTEIICIEVIKCPKCLQTIDYRTKRCPHCTSWIKEENA